MLGGQSACYNVQPQPPCTESASISQQNTSFASWKFKGSALRITSLLNYISPIYNVDIDGKITEADGAQIGKDSGPFTCFTLFTVDGLDPKVEHSVNLTVKGASPNRNTTIDRNGQATVLSFSRINYTYTTGDESGSTTGNSTDSNGNGNGAQQLHTISAIVLLLSTLALFTGFH
ncbi:hypothetical protein PM082_007404 [Marasmius tenuissimus]|nr:hypothetical protein PM082_007404 [Marasmius tenuissimus]